MEHSDASLLKLIARRFHRWGETGSSTGLLSELNGQYDDFIKSNIKLQEGEQIALIAITSEEAWSALTTRRLIGVNNGISCIMEWNKIRDVDADTAETNLASMEGSKNYISRLVITTINDTKVIVVAEPGPPCIGFWNAIRLAQQLSESWKGNGE